MDAADGLSARDRVLMLFERRPARRMRFYGEARNVAFIERLAIMEEVRRFAEG